MKEEWRDVVGYEGLYEVSNTGKIKIIERDYFSGRKKSNKMKTKPVELSYQLDKDGYLDVQLRKDNSRRTSPRKIKLEKK